MSAGAPDLPCCISFEVLPEIKEYERTSTTVINTYVMPIVARYLAYPAEELDRAWASRAPLLLMQSNGGLTTAEAAMKTPMHIIESGPAAGVYRCAGPGACPDVAQRHYLRYGRDHRESVDRGGGRSGAVA